MRPLATLSVLLASTFAFAQSPAEKAATLEFVHSLYDPVTGGYRVTRNGKPSLRACNGAAKAVKYLGGDLPDRAKTAAFVMTCFDPATGGFAEPGSKPDVAITSIGVMAAVELGVPKDKFARAMAYLQSNAKTFEDVRIGAAAVEAWGVKDCPFDLKPWLATAREFGIQKGLDPKDGGARLIGSLVAMQMRLKQPVHAPVSPRKFLPEGQREDGGWGKAGEVGSDAETTYRVMRACRLLYEKPTNSVKVREFFAKCRNADGGYGTKPGEPSSLSGVYYAAVVGHWLDELDKVK